MKSRIFGIFLKIIPLKNVPITWQEKRKCYNKSDCQNINKEYLIDSKIVQVVQIVQNEVQLTPYKLGHCMIIWRRWTEIKKTTSYYSHFLLLIS